jgi:3-hydroxyisobutyryl-CoA hydrolase
MGLTGEKLKGEQLVKCGVATHYVRQDKFDNLKNIIIEKSGKDNTLEHITQIVTENSDLTYSKEIFEFPYFNEVEKTFDLTSLDDVYKRLADMIANGSDGEQKWAANILQILNKSSPISLAVTFEQVKRGKELKSIDEAFNLEAQMIAG